MLCNRANRSHDDQLNQRNQTCLCVYRNYKAANTAGKVVDSLIYRKDYVQFSLRNFSGKFLPGRFALAEVRIANLWVSDFTVVVAFAIKLSRRGNLIFNSNHF